MSTKLKNAKYTRSGGFTLVELLVVLVISVTVIGITTVAYNKLSSSAYLKSTARHVAASLRYARSYAIAKGVDARMQINLENRTYSYSGDNRSFKFKPEINLEVFSGNFLNQNTGTAEIRFAPDGSSSGGRVTLSSQTRSYIIRVDWLTGRVVVDG